MCIRDRAEAGTRTRQRFSSDRLGYFGLAVVQETALSTSTNRSTGNAVQQYLYRAHCFVDSCFEQGAGIGSTGLALYRSFSAFELARVDLCSPLLTLVISLPFENSALNTQCTPWCKVLGLGYGSAQHSCLVVEAQACLLYTSPSPRD